MAPKDRYLAYMGLAPKRIPHWEHWSCPDAETHITGIDYYAHPRQCRLRMNDLSLASLPACRSTFVCHDDIVTSRGPICSPRWMHKYVFPRFEEL